MTVQGIRVDMPNLLRLKLEAMNYGRLSFNGGGNCIPCLDKNIMDMIGRLKLQLGESLPLLNAWLEGWTDANVCAEYDKKVGTI